MKSFALLAAAAGVAALALGGNGFEPSAFYGSVGIDVGAGPFEPDPPSAPRRSATALKSCSGLPGPADLPLFVLGQAVSPPAAAEERM